VGDISADYSGRSRAVAERDEMRNDGQVSSEVERRAFRLLRLEKLIIALTVDGFSTKETAAQLGIDEPALEVRLASIYRKLHVLNQF
jgi:DNA-binding CsgD family transcriptional regulator